MTRAVLEGVAFNLHTGLRSFVENGIAIEAVDAIGGAANSALLLQIFADVWGVPVSRRSLVDEATAVGAAVVGGIGVGIFDDFAVAGRFSTRSAKFQPGLARHRQYGEEYVLFLEAYQRLEPWFTRL
jgi:xylulokinase